MLLLNKFFDHPDLLAWTSDSSTDYTLDESAPFLTKRQKEHLSETLGQTVCDLAWAKQVHGADVLVVDSQFIKDRRIHEADALVTDQKNVLIAVRTADCLPVFIWDATHEAMGIVHAGWKSTHQRIVQRTLDMMADRYGSGPEDIWVSFGPAIRSCCYKVSEEFAEHFPGSVFEADGQLFMDLIKENRDQLLSLGVYREQIFDSRICTVCSPGYFSYRRDGDKAGRMISGLLLRGNNG